MSVLLALLATGVGLALAGFGIFWVGFQTVPMSYPDIPLPEGASPLTPTGAPGAPAFSLGSELPPTLATHFEKTLGGPGDRPEIPELTSAVVWGRGRYRLFGFMVPMRFRSLQRPGDAFLRTIEVTWFGRAILRIREEYSNGVGSRSVEGWTTSQESGPEVNQQLRQDLWRQALWAPTALAGTSWTKVEENRWRCPAGGFDAVFHPKSGRLKTLEGTPETLSGSRKNRWSVSLGGWQRFHGIEIPTLLWFRNRGRRTSKSASGNNTVFVAQGVAYHLDLSGDLLQVHRSLNTESPGSH